MSELTPAQILEAGVAFWALLADNPEARRGLRLLSQDTKALRIVVKLMDDRFPDDKPARTQRRRRQPAADNGTGGDELLGKGEVCSALGIREWQFVKLLKDPNSELSQIVVKKGNRNKFRPEDVQALVKQRREAGEDRPW